MNHKVSSSMSNVLMRKLGAIPYLNRDHCCLYHVPESPHRRVHVLCKARTGVLSVSTASDAFREHMGKTEPLWGKGISVRNWNRPSSPRASTPAAPSKHKRDQIKGGTPSGCVCRWLIRHPGLPSDGEWEQLDGWFGIRQAGVWAESCC